MELGRYWDDILLVLVGCDLNSGLVHRLLPFCEYCRQPSRRFFESTVLRRVHEMNGTGKVTAELIRGLKHERDELKLQMHLASMEAREEFSNLADKLDALDHQYEPLKEAVESSAEDVLDSLKLVGYEIRDGLKRIRDAL